MAVLTRMRTAAVIPSIQMASAGLDSIGAIVGFAIASGVAITSGNLVYSILSGPLQVASHQLHAAFPNFSATAYLASSGIIY